MRIGSGVAGGLGAPNTPKRGGAGPARGPAPRRGQAPTRGGLLCLRAAHGKSGEERGDRADGPTHGYSLFATGRRTLATISCGHHATTTRVGPGSSPVRGARL